MMSNKVHSSKIHYHNDCFEALFVSQILKKYLLVFGSRDVQSIFVGFSFLFCRFTMGADRFLRGVVHIEGSNVPIEAIVGERRCVRRQ